jgi:hypothetical protein
LFFSLVTAIIGFVRFQSMKHQIAEWDGIFQPRENPDEAPSTCASHGAGAADDRFLRRIGPVE